MRTTRHSPLLRQPELARLDHQSANAAFRRHRRRLGRMYTRPIDMHCEDVRIDPCPDSAILLYDPPDQSETLMFPGRFTLSENLHCFLPMSSSMAFPSKWLTDLWAMRMVWDRWLEMVIGNLAKPSILAVFMFQVLKGFHPGKAKQHNNRQNTWKGVERFVVVVFIHSLAHHQFGEYHIQRASEQNKQTDRACELYDWTWWWAKPVETPTSISKGVLELSFNFFFFFNLFFVYVQITERAEQRDKWTDGWSSVNPGLFCPGVLCPFFVLFFLWPGLVQQPQQVRQWYPAHKGSHRIVLEYICIDFRFFTITSPPRIIGWSESGDDCGFIFPLSYWLAWKQLRLGYEQIELVDFDQLAVDLDMLLANQPNTTKRTTIRPSIHPSMRSVQGGRVGMVPFFSFFSVVSSHYSSLRWPCNDDAAADDVGSVCRSILDRVATSSYRNHRGHASNKQCNVATNIHRASSIGYDRYYYYLL